MLRRGLLPVRRLASAPCSLRAPPLAFSGTAQAARANAAAFSRCLALPRKLSTSGGSNDGVAAANENEYGGAYHLQNHVWTEEEIQKCIAEKDKKFEPQSISDHIMVNIMRGLYHTFNAITGYKEENPTTKSIEWRLIVLESFAGVPGFLAAAFRHFYSLRTLKKNEPFIFTLLEEANNERMHLLVCLKQFNASLPTRLLVMSAQFTMVPFLMLVYALHPPAMHRFVGHLEETAVHTYANIIHNIETPGTNLHRDWAGLAAPKMAIDYWQLPPDADWLLVMKHVLADEAHHRDVNHGIASLGSDPQENPFLDEHQQDFDRAALKRTEELVSAALKQSGKQATYVSSSKPLHR